MPYIIPRSQPDCQKFCEKFTLRCKSALKSFKWTIIVLVSPWWPQTIPTVCDTIHVSWECRRSSIYPCKLTSSLVVNCLVPLHEVDEINKPDELISPNVKLKHFRCLCNHKHIRYTSHELIRTHRQVSRVIREPKNIKIPECNFFARILTISCVLAAT